MLAKILGFPTDRPLTEDERRMVLRAIVALAIPLAIFTVLINSVIFFYSRHLSNERIKDVRALVVELDNERLERARAINRFIYTQCIEDEVRDVIITEQLRAAQQRARASLPPGPLLTGQLETLQAGIDALEPDDEPDCVPPPVEKKP